MSFSPGDIGQGWIEYVLILILIGIVGNVVWQLFAPALQLHMGQLILQITGK